MTIVEAYFLGQKTLLKLMYEALQEGLTVNEVLKIAVDTVEIQSFVYEMEQQLKD